MMSDFLHVAGQNWDEVHEAGPNPGDPSVLVARIVGARGRIPNVVQAFVEAMNVADVFEAELPNLPVASRAKVTAALAKVRQVPRP